MKPKMLTMMLLIFLMTAVVCAAQEDTKESSPAPEQNTQVHKAPNYTLNFDYYSQALTAAGSTEETLKVAEDAVSNCKTYDDYDKLAAVLKDMAQKPRAKNIDALHYAIANTRFEQLKSLSKANDIDSGRLYMSVADSYYGEALDNLEKCALESKSKQEMLDVDFLKVMIFKEKFRPQESANAFNDIVNKLIQYNEDPAARMKEIERMSDKFNLAGLPDYALKLKIGCASQMDQNGAREIFNSIKKSADQYFAQGNFKDAATLYDQYTTLAQSYFPKDDMAASLMEIGERYFAAAKYKEARQYYELYIQRYQDSKVIDYCNYRIAMCFYYEKDYVKAISQFEAFIAAYQTSVWYDKAFETLCKLYYENFDKDKAIEGLERLIDKYYRKNVGDYAHVLIGLLHYGSKDYNNAAAQFKKVDATSIYFYPAQTLLDDIAAIKSGSRPSFGLDSTNNYRIWEPYQGIGADLVPEEAKNAKGWLGNMGAAKGAKFNLTQSRDGAPLITLGKGALVNFKLEGLEDLDKYAEYLQDKEDLSRLPKKIKEESEKDLISLQWSCDGGKFLDESETKDKVWQAPDQPGNYKVSVRADDFGLVRLPDKGVRKDSPKELVLTVVVE